MTKAGRLGIVSYSMEGVKLPKERAGLRFHWGQAEHNEFRVVRVALSNGLTVTRFEDWAGETWKLWHVRSVFFGSDKMDCRVNYSTAEAAPKVEKALVFPTAELDEWLTREDLGFSLDVFTATAVAQELEARLHDVGQAVEAWASADGWAAKQRAKRAVKRLVKDYENLQELS